MAIKPLEKKKNIGMILKIVFLVALIGAGLLIDKVFANKKKDLAKVLGKSQEIKKEVEQKLIDEVQNSDIVVQSLKTGEKIGGEILGQSTNFISDITAKAASMAGDIIYQSSIGKLVEQIDKLPQDQQDRIKEQICH
ncbi:MAG: hypothetical protein UU09_C0004G0006 [Microgenomates group bacterium GW2011_GWA2_40_6]|nr:MAG: hypothetical protein UU09_C0004G0006 [Microgenomates group bacterium GW2011_GWA2_40_6]